MKEHIRQSNLIEGIDDPKEDEQSMKAWRYLSSRVGINELTLVDLHSLITVNQLPPEQMGRYRKVMVQVGEYTPPAPILVKHLMSDWLADFLKKEPKQAHIEFEKIHPFIDGNGRTGRMLMWWHELKLGQKPTLLKASERQEYYKWFHPISETLLKGLNND